MRFRDRFSVTLRCLRVSLFPCGGTGSPCDVLPPSGSCRSVSPEELSGRLVDGRFFGKERGELSLFLPGAIPLAAPFVLFLLKRRGYSDCRVVAEREGLQVMARR